MAQGDTGAMVDVIGWRLDDVVKLIKGPKGTHVRLQILPAETGVNGPPVTISHSPLYNHCRLEVLLQFLLTTDSYPD